ncbi:hypothetical protein LCGC14_2423070 [marine sediment metagenome]|uniref:Uncharacterized protein n=1 Tax=marine sediment metagenome TaxID=412755 RepID=A0A0F9BP67_9ZZZZ
MTLFDIAILVIAAFGAGVLNTIAGGGTFLTFPALVFTGMPPVAANATSAVAVFPGYLAGAFGFRNELGGFDRKRLLRLSLITLSGGAVGSGLLLVSSNEAFSIVVPFLLLAATLAFLLGDRIRMDAIADLPGLFIRSLSSRGARNGLCDNVVDLLALLEGHGFSEILLETVGVGQSEVAVREVVDTLVVIVPPDAGDSVQTMKAGILEMADIVVVTKADQPGAQRMAADLAAVLRARAGRETPVIQTQSSGLGVAALSAAITAHYRWINEHRPATLSREKRRIYHLKALIERQIHEALRSDQQIAQGTLCQSYDRLLASLRVT